ncbi:hypothetical protein QR680_015977 [Steinernema hermaphroditum]|uniref:Uncharacterized protein n=1 Tax=Steinernema hermaphroditum TaxID=289476 RepID=A0AA39H9L8_9BILA|nr:hypothetical protein QR680_015977 [Steinernema hermaphroditum]
MSIVCGLSQGVVSTASALSSKSGTLGIAGTRSICPRRIVVSSVARIFVFALFIFSPHLSDVWSSSFFFAIRTTSSANRSSRNTSSKGGERTSSGLHLPQSFFNFGFQELHAIFGFRLGLSLYVHAGGVEVFVEVLSHRALDLPQALRVLYRFFNQLAVISAKAILSAMVDCWHRRSRRCCRRATRTRQLPGCTSPSPYTHLANRGRSSTFSALQDRRLPSG